MPCHFKEACDELPLATVPIFGEALTAHQGSMLPAPATFDNLHDWNGLHIPSRYSFSAG